MKIKSFFAIIFLLQAFTTQAQTLNVGTFNVRLETSRDTGNLWTDRKVYVANLIRFHGFDVFGTQEGFKNQLDDIQSQLPEYERYGIG
ncbi:MAG: endonuclease, partial [Sediminibacterium sp.]